jgi:hypothetical protein
MRIYVLAVALPDLLLPLLFVVSGWSVIVHN